jgi:hypothetical protein
MQNPKINKLYDKPIKKTNPPEEVFGFLKLARERARDGTTFWKDNWEAAEDDLIFLSGEQWPSQVRTERELEQRPCLVNNVLPTFIDQVLGDQRQNKPSIKVNPIDMVSVKSSDEEKPVDLKINSVTGQNDYTLAECFSGLIKSIEYNCNAETAYDMAFQACVQSGFGYLRVLSDYSVDDTFDQELIIKHIDNQFSVIFDPAAKEYDYSDANWCIIDDVMDKDEFKNKYPNSNAEPVNTDVTTDMEGWFADHTVRVSEYIIRKPEVREQALMSDGSRYWLDEIEPIVDELLERDVTIVRTRKSKTSKVIWYKITGTDVLEGPIELDCTTIPVVPVFGKSISIKKKKIYLSLIRHSKDAQRMVNYWDSAATESVALAPKAPFIGSEGHVEGREEEWEKANTTNLALLTYIPQFQGDKGPRREQPSMVPAAELTMSANSIDKIKATMGMFDASLGAEGNETSGRAIIARQRQGDRGSFTFIDNLSKSIRRVGKLLVELVPHIYDTERVVRIKFQDETEDYVKLNEQVLDEESGKWVTINDLGVSQYDVVVTTGPAYTTQRMEAADAMIKFAQAVPTAAAVMADLIAQNMDWPGADKISERLKKIVPPNVLTAKERDQLAEDTPETEGPTPDQEVQMAELEVRTVEAEAKGETAKAISERAAATIAQAQADLVKAQLETAEAQAQISSMEQGVAGGDISYQQVRELVAQALAEVVATQK